MPDLYKVSLIQVVQQWTPQQGDVVLSRWIAEEIAKSDLQNRRRIFADGGVRLNLGGRLGRR
jgi:hypothetical protein